MAMYLPLHRFNIKNSDNSESNETFQIQNFKTKIRNKRTALFKYEI